MYYKKIFNDLNNLSMANVQKNPNPLVNLFKNLHTACQTEILRVDEKN